MVFYRQLGIKIAVEALKLRISECRDLQSAISIISLLPRVLFCFVKHLSDFFSSIRQSNFYYIIIVRFVEKINTVRP